MAVQSATTLKGYFNTGDTPTESNFADLIDTVDSKGDIPYQTSEPSAPSAGTLWIDSDDVSAQSNSLLVAETIVSGSAVTSVTFSDLDGNTDGGYVLECSVLNSTSTVGEIATYINSDTSSNNADYHGVTVYTSYGTADNTAKNTKTNGTSLTGSPLAANNTTSFICSIKRDQAGRVVYTNTIAQNYGTDLTMYSAVTTKYTQVTNITSLTVTSTVSSSIAVGSTFRLYRRK